MKKMLTLSVITGLLVSLSFAQFTTGTKSVSSVFSYSSVKDNKDDNDSYTTVSINPNGSYFVIDNVSVDVAIDLITEKEGDDDAKTTNIGFGGSYYYPLETGAVYGGAGYKMGSYTLGDLDALKTNLLNIKAGYLYGFTENWYFDIGLRYNMQMGTAKLGSDDITGAEGMTTMWFGVGLATFF